MERAAAAGEQHTVLLRDDGTAMAFGDNCSDQCELCPAWRRFVANRLPPRAAQDFEERDNEVPALGRYWEGGRWDHPPTQ